MRKQVHMALWYYLEDNGGNYPMAWDGNKDWTHNAILGRYVGDSQVEHVLWCPSDPAFEGYWSGGYGMNWMLYLKGKLWRDERPETVGIMDYRRPTIWSSWLNGVHFPHNDGANCLLLDGQVEWKSEGIVDKTVFGF